MFKDYYKILGISYPSSRDEIKRAYRNMSLKWHPDKNIEKEAIRVMQDINEAYAILKDVEKKSRYDAEYSYFTKSSSFSSSKNRDNQSNKDSSENNETSPKWSYNYDVKDDHLKEDIKNAREYARKIVDEFLRDLKETSKVAIKAGTKSALQYAIALVIASLILSILGLLF